MSRAYHSFWRVHNDRLLQRLTLPSRPLTRAQAAMVALVSLLLAVVLAIGAGL